MTPGQIAYEAHCDLLGVSSVEPLLPWGQLSDFLQRAWEATALAAHAAGAIAARMEEAHRTGLAWLAHVRGNLPDTPDARVVCDCAELTVAGFLAVLRGERIPDAMRRPEPPAEPCTSTL